MTYGRIGVLVDERYGHGVIDAVKGSAQPLVLAVPVEASGHDWFTLEWGDQWLEHVETIKPDYAKVLVRDNPGFDPAQREQQLGRLAQISSGLPRDRRATALRVAGACYRRLARPGWP